MLKSVLSHARRALDILDWSIIALRWYSISGRSARTFIGKQETGAICWLPWELGLEVSHTNEAGKFLIQLTAPQPWGGDGEVREGYA